MPIPVAVRLVSATDAQTIAQLHAASWRVAYRDILSPAYLAQEIDADRLGVWSRRLDTTHADAFGLLADVDGQPAGFAYVTRSADAKYGNLLDNIHVAAAHARRGVGRQLCSTIAAEIIRRGWSRSLHLWVYDANGGARRFYDALGGERVESGLRDAPDGQQIPAGRYYWRDISVLR